MRGKIKYKIEVENFIYTVSLLLLLIPCFFIDYVSSFIGMTLVGTIILIWGAIIENKYVVKVSAPLILFGLLAVWIFCSAIIHNNGYGVAWIYIILFVELLVLILNTGNDNVLIWLIQVLGCFHMLCTMLIQIIPDVITNKILLSILGEQYWSNYNWRIVQGYNCGITLQPGENAMYIMLFFVVMYSKWIVYGKRENLVGMFIAYITMITTGKRGAIIISLLVSIIIFLNVKKKNVSKTHFIFGTLSILCVLIAFICIVRNSNVLQALTNKIQISNNYNDISSGRFEIWRSAWKTFFNHVLIGNGIKSVYHEYGIDVHNNYLQFLNELGIVGFIILFFLLMDLLKRCYIKLNKIKYLGVEICDRVKFIFAIYMIVYFVIYAFIGNPFVDYIPLQIFTLSCSILLKQYITTDRRGKE